MMIWIRRSRHARGILALIALPILISWQRPRCSLRRVSPAFRSANPGPREMGCFTTAREVLDRTAEGDAFWRLAPIDARCRGLRQGGRAGPSSNRLGKSAVTIARLDGDQQAENACGDRPASLGQGRTIRCGLHGRGIQTRHRVGSASRSGAGLPHACGRDVRGNARRRSLVQRAGDPGVIVPGGQPMELIGTGESMRRSLVLIQQDARDSVDPRERLDTQRICRT